MDEVMKRGIKEAHAIAASAHRRAAIGWRWASDVQDGMPDKDALKLLNMARELTRQATAATSRTYTTAEIAELAHDAADSAAEDDHAEGAATNDHDRLAELHDLQAEHPHQEVAEAHRDGNPCPGCGAREYEDCTHTKNIEGMCPYFDLQAPLI